MDKKGYQFNTFSGVFLPSILSILGVVMFMFLGSNIAKFGVLGALGILFFAESIAVATGLSISAISTNTAVRGGGPYFLISRSLGPGFGSSIGITYYASQSLAVPFYIIGFGEAILNTFPEYKEFRLLVWVVPLVILAVIAIVGADWAVKAQYFIMAVLGISVIVMIGGAVFAGPTAAQFKANLDAAEGQDVDILTLAAGFALFFPAVTGFLAGANMSGDLADPKKSIPRGTLAAIGVGLAIYLVEILLFAAVWDRASLTNENGAYYKTLFGNALFHLKYLVLAGAVAATLSSALGTLVGAPRILQAFAADKIFRPLNPFAKGRGRGNDPILAMILTLAITVVVLLVSARFGGKSDGGPLGMVAGLVTMFTLFTYAIINISAAVESFAANPSFRPSFQAYHWLVGVYGALASFAAALFINAGLLIIAFVVVGGLFFLAKRQSLKRTFGDTRRGYYFQHIRRALVRLDKMPPDAKNWRPQLLILSGGEPRHLPLAQYGALLNNGRGILSVARFIAESNDVRDTERRRREALAEMRKLSGRENTFFPTVVAIPDMAEFDRALHIFLQSRSLGALTPNIVLTGWPSHPDRVAAFCRHLLVIRQLKMNSLILLNPDVDDTPETPLPGTIDIWWRGRRNGSLMLILAYLVTCDRRWRKTPIRLLRAVSNGDRSGAESDLQKLVKDARIESECVTVDAARPFAEVFRETSAHAALIFLGFVPPEEAEFQAFYDRMTALTQGMPPVFLASSAGDTDIDS